MVAATRKPNLQKHNAIAPGVGAAARASAVLALTDCAQDSSFWRDILGQKEVLAFLRDALGAKIKRDGTFARHVLAARDRMAFGERSPLRQDQPSIAKTATSVSKNSMLVSRTLGSSQRKRKVEMQLPAVSFDTSCIATPPHWKRGTPAHRPVRQEAGAKTAPPTYVAATMDVDHSCKSASDADAVTIAARRCLASAFDDEFALGPDGCNAHVDEGFLSPLATVVVAEIASFLSFKETVRLALLTRDAGNVLLRSSAWEPLILDKEDSKVFLRHLRDCDPIGALSADPLPLPRGLFEVTELNIELMDADVVNLDDTDEAILSLATCRITASPRPVLDPLEEFCRHLRRKFSAVTKVFVTNIEDHRMDYRFLQLRTSVLFDFAHVRLSVAILDAASRYSLVASRRANDFNSTLPASFVSLEIARPNLDAILVASAARRPQSAGMLLGPADSIDEAEARFLEEHTSAFKSGDLFHIAHAPWRTVSADAVRKRYRMLFPGTTGQ